MLPFASILPATRHSKWCAGNVSARITNTLGRFWVLRMCRFFWKG
jgi:hypothetical protein